MAKANKNTNILLILIVLLSIFLFSSSFYAGYFYGNSLFQTLGLRFSANDDVEVKDDDQVAVSYPSESLPDSFPKDFPIYSQAELKNSWTALGNTTEGISVLWETKDGVKQVSDYYEKKLQLSSWQIISQYDKEGSGIITFEKEGVSGFVGITKGDSGKTVISVTMGIAD